MLILPPFLSKDISVSILHTSKTNLTNSITMIIIPLTSSNSITIPIAIMIIITELLLLSVLSVAAGVPIIAIAIVM